MSIFTRIKDAIFGDEPPADAAAPKPAPQSAPKPATTSGIPASPADAKWGRAVDMPKADVREVDVEAVLELRSAHNPQKLNWRTSIVDLMKLLDLDSSATARKRLADELRYQGDKKNSAKMNIWLHKQVMIKLAENGGKVPDDLKR